MPWTYAHASALGVSHARSGTRMQDASACLLLDDDTFFGIVSDGAGSAEFGGEGASVICRTFTTCIREHYRMHATLPEDDMISAWVNLARSRIASAADARSKTSRDFAATLVLVIANPAEVLTAHIGDGAVVARSRSDQIWKALSKPAHGEYAATTFFLTDQPEPALRIGRHSDTYDAISCFTDGIESLVLDFQSWEPSPAFFEPMVAPLVQSSIVGRESLLSSKLADFLSGPRLAERTDDDKSLVLALLR